MVNKKKKPEIRFKEFEEDWVENMIGDFYFFKNGLNKGKEYFGSGVPIVNYTDVFRSRGLKAHQLNGRVMLSESEIKNYEVRQGDIFFTRTSETIEEIGYASVMLDKPFHTAFSGFVLRGRAISTDPMEDVFKQYAFFTKSFRAEMQRKSTITTRALTSGTAIKAMFFVFPQSKIEQSKIGIFFDYLNNLIELRGRENEQTVNIKKAMIEKMFPKKGENVPEVRFDGFTETWEQRKLKELVTPVFREVPKPSKSYKRMSIRSHAKGTFHQMVDDPDTVAMEKLFVVHENDLVVNITFAWEHAIAVAKKEDNGLLVSHRFPTYEMNESDPNFIRVLVYKENFRRKMELISPGGAGRNRVLNKNDFIQIEEIVPTFPEQNAIGNFFRSLDTLIEAQQQELEKLQNIKNALLDKMFV